MENLKITIVDSFDSSLVEPIGRMLQQLTGTKTTFDEEQLRIIIREMSCRLFVARSQGEVVGMFSLCTYSSPSMRKVWLEDVVVDSAARGRGIGRAMVAYAINFARQIAPCCLLLTSSPHRTEANALYRSMGFEPKQTNLYKMDF